MKKKTELRSRLFKATTNNEAEQKASDWASKFIREENRTSWVDQQLMFNVEVVVVVAEEVK